MSELNFKISAESKSATKVIAKARQFEIIIDEPQDLGGKDEAPNPVETLLASYAGCFNVVLHLLAKERNIEINHLKIDIIGNINPQKLLGISKEERAGFKNIDLDITIDSSAEKSVIENLIKDAKERCPINDNLSNPTPVNFQLN